MPDNPKDYVLSRLKYAKNNSTSHCQPFNWYYKPYTDYLHTITTKHFIGKVDTGIFEHEGSLYTSGEDLLIYLGEK
jgi:hypothetical protein